jgi:hypothetical protein
VSVDGRSVAGYDLDSVLTYIFFTHTHTHTHTHTDGLRLRSVTS